jgi:hypothetical protein
MTERDAVAIEDELSEIGGDEWVQHLHPISQLRRSIDCDDGYVSDIEQDANEQQRLLRSDEERNPSSVGELKVHSYSL